MDITDTGFVKAPINDILQKLGIVDIQYPLFLTS